MDATVQTALNTALGGLKDDAVSMLASNIPTAAIVLVTVAVLFFGIKTFRAIAHV